MFCKAARSRMAQSPANTVLLLDLAQQAAAHIARADQVGAHVVFDFGAGDRLTVLNTTMAALRDDISIL